MSGFELHAGLVEALALGAGVLGTGGGGNPYVNAVELRSILQAHGPLPVVALDEVADDDLAVALGGFGAPTVSFEKVGRSGPTLLALRAVEHHLGRPATHVLPGEIGGGNALLPASVAVLAGVPLVDADGMGRAFPEAHMNVFGIRGVPLSPAAFADAHGEVALFTGVRGGDALERLARPAVVAMGASVGSAFPAVDGRVLRATAIPGSVSRALAIGDAVLAARSAHDDPAEAGAAAAGGRVLARGKVVDVDRRTEGGFARGLVAVATDAGRVEVDLQNELLLARCDGEVLAAVPELLSIVDRETGEAIGTEALRYGQRVAVLLLPAPAQLRTPEALEVVGPSAFGYDVPATPGTAGIS